MAFRFLMLAVFWALGGAASAAVEIPPLSKPVHDEAGLLSSQLRDKLGQALQQLWQDGGSQVAVLTLPDLGGDSIEAVSIQVVDKWKLGTGDKDNGVLLLIARNDRKVRIEVGQGVEDKLTDAHSKRIIDKAIIPLFKDGRFSDGVLVGVYEIIKRTDPDFPFERYFASVAAGRPSREKSLPFGLVVFIVFLIIIATSRGSGPRGRRGGLGDWSSSGGFGGFGGGGGGGSYSGRGGGFSGGGASSSW